MRKKPCVVPQCTAQFDPALRAMPPASDGSSFTGWFWPDNVHDIAPLHDHEFASEYQPCPCGWTYDRDTLTGYVRGEVSIDLHPTHRCFHIGSIPTRAR